MRVSLLVCCVLSAAACGGGGGGGGTGDNPVAPPPPPAQAPPVGSTGTPPTSTTNTVVVSNNSFAPGDVTVPAGTTVTWTWDSCTGDGYGGSTCASHNVTFEQGGPNSATQSTGEFSRQFTAAGTFPYRCTVHGASMSGRVVVR